MTPDERTGEPLSILICDRRVPANADMRPALAVGLEELGQRVKVIADGPADLSLFDVVILSGNPGYYPRLRRQLLSSRPAPRPLIATLHTEPLPPPKASGLPRWSPLSVSEIGKILLRDWRATDIYTNAFKLRRMMREGTIDLLFVMSAEKQEWAAEQGFQSWYIPYGYHGGMGGLLGLERDVDVLFLGDTRPLRRRRLLSKLRRAGIDVTVRGSWHPDGRGLWGEERTRFLNRTKILVHLQRYPGKLAAIRYVIAMTNGALVISEPPYRPEPFIEGEHFVAANIERMPEVIRHYLAHPEERERITASAHRFVTGELTYRRSLGMLLDVVRDRLAKVI